MYRIGFIGLGIMGRPMAKNLLQAGRDLTVYDVRPEPVKELTDAGAKAAASLPELGAACDVIFTMVPDAPDVRAAVCCPDGILAGARPGTILVDTSSLSPQASREIEESCRTAEVTMLDAPVSGGEPRAVDGTLAFMVGGRKDAFDRVYDILMDMGSTAVLVGGHGAGSMAKLANQVMVNLNIVAMAEAMELAVSGGVDPALVFEAVRGGLAGSAVLDAKMPMVLDGDFRAGGAVRINRKDIRNVLETAETLDLDLPMTRHLKYIFDTLANQGLENQDHAAIVQYYEQKTGIRIRRKTEAL